MPDSSHRPGRRGRWLAGLAAAALAVVGAMWAFSEAPSAQTRAPSAAASATAAASAVAAAATAAAPAASVIPFSAAGLQARQAQQALWQQRLERAQEALAAYRQSTRYPYESQPMGDHADQAYPNRAIDEEHALRMPGGQGHEGVRLRTSQERVFVQGHETVRFSVALHDDAGRMLPMRIVRASAREVPAPQTAATYGDVTMNFNDEGMAGDATAGDGAYGVQLQPATQGFAGLFGQIRVEVYLEHRGQQGFTYFDIVYTPRAPATWQDGARETLADGSLHFILNANVLEAGRYVVTGRVDDADGKPFALLSFNDEVPVGTQDIRLTLYGKLVRDAKPAFPLTLRDVDAFLLLPDAFPDRRLMPRRAGPVHVSAPYPLASFTEADWRSEERDRTLDELNRDVAQAQARVEQPGSGP